MQLFSWPSKSINVPLWNFVDKTVDFFPVVEVDGGNSSETQLFLIPVLIQIPDDGKPYITSRIGECGLHGKYFCNQGVRFREIA